MAQHKILASRKHPLKSSPHFCCQQILCRTSSVLHSSAPRQRKEQPQTHQPPATISSHSNLVSNCSSLSCTLISQKYPTLHYTTLCDAKERESWSHLIHHFFLFFVFFLGGLFVTFFFGVGAVPLFSLYTCCTLFLSQLRRLKGNPRTEYYYFWWNWQENTLPCKCIHKVFINFVNPWFKKKTRKKDGKENKNAFGLYLSLKEREREIEREGERKRNRLRLNRK